jgi:hypothetical protein
VGIPLNAPPIFPIRHVCRLVRFVPVRVGVTACVPGVWKKPQVSAKLLPPNHFLAYLLASARPKIPRPVP